MDVISKLLGQDVNPSRVSTISADKDNKKMGIAKGAQVSKRPPTAGHSVDKTAVTHGARRTSKTLG